MASRIKREGNVIITEKESDINRVQSLDIVKVKDALSATEINSNFEKLRQQLNKVAIESNNPDLVVPEESITKFNSGETVNSDTINNNYEVLRQAANRIGGLFEPEYSSDIIDDSTFGNLNPLDESIDRLKDEIDAVSNALDIEATRINDILDGALPVARAIAASKRYQATAITDSDDLIDKQYFDDNKTDSVGVDATNYIDEDTGVYKFDSNGAPEVYGKNKSSLETETGYLRLLEDPNTGEVRLQANVDEIVGLPDLSIKSQSVDIEVDEADPTLPIPDYDQRNLNLQNKTNFSSIKQDVAVIELEQAVQNNAIADNAVKNIQQDDRLQDLEDGFRTFVIVRQFKETPQEIVEGAGFEYIENWDTTPQDIDAFNQFDKANGTLTIVDDNSDRLIQTHYVITLAPAAGGTDTDGELTIRNKADDSVLRTITWAITDGQSQTFNLTFNENVPATGVGLEIGYAVEVFAGSGNRNVNATISDLTLIQFGGVGGGSSDSDKINDTSSTEPTGGINLWKRDIDINTDRLAEISNAFDDSDYSDNGNFKYVNDNPAIIGEMPMQSDNSRVELKVNFEQATIDAFDNNGDPIDYVPITDNGVSNKKYVDDTIIEKISGDSDYIVRPSNSFPLPLTIDRYYKFKWTDGFGGIWLLEGYAKSTASIVGKKWYFESSVSRLEVVDFGEFQNFTSSTSENVVIEWNGSNNRSIKNITSVSNDTDVANKKYVDDQLGGNTDFVVLAAPVSGNGTYNLIEPITNFEYVFFEIQTGSAVDGRFRSGMLPTSYIESTIGASDVAIRKLGYSVSTGGTSYRLDLEFLNIATIQITNASRNLDRVIGYKRKANNKGNKK